MGASNPFFNTTTYVNEQNLLEDLFAEAVSINGHTLYYCPRTVIDKDDIYGEDTISEYNSHFEVDMYVKTVDSYEGDGTFLSKFNLEIRDQMTFSVPRKTFINEVTSNSGIQRPREGDLIWSPVFERLLIIKYVSNSPVFYQLGTLPSWDITCEMFEYSNERLNTGIRLVDQIQKDNSTVMEYPNILTSNGFALTDALGNLLVQGQFDDDEQNKDVFSDNEEFDEEDERYNIIDWSERDPFADLI